jgi:hypothetical protein
VNRILTLGALPLVLAAAAACAPRATRAADAAAEPRLEGCSAFQTAEPGGLTNTGYSPHFVTVRVDATGKVVPGSAEVHRARATVTSREQRARQLAESCTFEPATLGGAPTEGRARVLVYVPNETE